MAFPRAYSQPESKSAWPWLVASIFLFSTVGVLLPAYSVIRVAMDVDGEHFVVPGAYTFTAEKPATYGLWVETATTFQGRKYVTDDELPEGATITLLHDDSGDEIPFEAATMKSTESVGDTHRRALGDFAVEKTGAYTLSVGGDFEERIFYFRRSILGDLAGLGSVFLLALGVGWLGALVLFVVFVVRVLKTTNNAGPEFPRQQPTG